MSVTISSGASRAAGTWGTLHSRARSAQIARSFAALRTTAQVILASLATPAILAAQASGPVLITPTTQLTGGGATRLGTGLSLSGDDLLATGVEASPSSPALQFVFHRSAGTWSQQAAFEHDEHPLLGCTGDSTALSIAGDLLVIGEPFNGSLGKAWISKRTGAIWSPLTYIEDQDYFSFGQAVLLYAGMVFVGMPDDPFVGGVSIWSDTLAGWKKLKTLFPTPPYHAAMGALLASSGTTLLAGERDAVRVFVQGATPIDWSLQALLDPAGTAVVRAIAIDSDVAVLSTDNSGGCSTSAPAVLVYERAGSTWTQTASLTAADAAPPELGSSLAVSGDSIWIGAESHPSGSASGALYLFQRSGTTWVQIAKLESDPTLPSQSYFGASLDIDGATLAVGAPGLGSNPGTVQVFDVQALALPQTYCTAKLNSQGCVPQMFASGVPGMTNPGPFLLRATNVLNNKTALLFYSTAGAASLPFLGGTLCLASPISRTPRQSTGGHPPPDDCSGRLDFDFNGFAQGGADPALLPGAQVWAQYFYRDPADAFQAGLTDAVVFTIGS